jgi:hypothetical protein
VNPYFIRLKGFDIFGKALLLGYGSIIALNELPLLPVSPRESSQIQYPFITLILLYPPPYFFLMFIIIHFAPSILPRYLIPIRPVEPFEPVVLAILFPSTSLIVVVTQPPRDFLEPPEIVLSA